MSTEIDWHSVDSSVTHSKTRLKVLQNIPYNHIRDSHDWIWVHDSDLNPNGVTAVKEQDYDDVAFNFDCIVHIRDTCKTMEPVQFVCACYIVYLTVIGNINTSVVIGILSTFILTFCPAAIMLMCCSKIVRQNWWNKTINTEADLIVKYRSEIAAVEITMPDGVTSDTVSNAAVILNMFKHDGYVEQYDAMLRNLLTFEASSIEKLYSVENTGSSVMLDVESLEKTAYSYDDRKAFLQTHMSEENAFYGAVAVTKSQIAKLVEQNSRLSILNNVLENQEQFSEDDMMDVQQVVNVMLECSSILDAGKKLASSEEAYKAEQDKFDEVVSKAVPIFEKAIQHTHEERFLKLDAANLYLDTAFCRENSLT